MKVFFPIIQNMADALSQGDNMEASLLLQKQILKIFYALIQYTMPLGECLTAIFMADIYFT